MGTRGVLALPRRLRAHTRVLTAGISTHPRGMLGSVLQRPTGRSTCPSSRHARGPTRAAEAASRLSVARRAGPQPLVPGLWNKWDAGGLPPNELEAAKPMPKAGGAGVACPKTGGAGALSARRGVSARRSLRNSSALSVAVAPSAWRALCSSSLLALSTLGGMSAAGLRLGRRRGFSLWPNISNGVLVSQRCFEPSSPRLPYGCTTTHRVYGKYHVHVSCKALTVLVFLSRGGP